MASTEIACTVGVPYGLTKGVVGTKAGAVVAAVENSIRRGHVEDAAIGGSANRSDRHLGPHRQRRNGLAAFGISEQRRLKPGLGSIGRWKIDGVGAAGDVEVPLRIGSHRAAHIGATSAEIFRVDNYGIDGQRYGPVELAKLEADLVGGKQHIFRGHFPAISMLCLKHARCKLSQLTEAGLNDKIALLVQPNAAGAANVDSDAIGLRPSGKVQIVFQPPGMAIEHRIDAWIKIADAGLGE